jgi:hypothetical protein
MYGQKQPMYGQPPNNKRTRTDAGFSPSNPNNIDQSNSNLIQQNQETVKEFLAQLDNLKDSCGEQVKSLFPFLLTLFQQQQSIITSLHQQNVQENPAEIKERERSLVLVNLPESKAEKPSMRVKDDQKAAEDILDELGIQAPVLTTYRMGKENNNHPRLLKLVLPASVFRNMALGSWKRNRNNIKKKQQYHQLIIRPSLSPAELVIDRARRAEYRRQKEAETSTQLEGLAMQMQQNQENA